MERNLIRIRTLDREDITRILDQSKAFLEIMDRPIRKVPALRGKVVVNLFFEPSTRTRTSFELAAKMLSADVVNITAGASSAVKGESIKDTALTLKSLGANFIVVRHTYTGVPELIAKQGNFSVINGGDGFGEHPTQALLDIFTIRQKKGRLEGLNVAIIGDIMHSRVARSNIYALNKMGAHVHVVAPPTLLPIHIEQLGVTVHHRFDDLYEIADVLYLLRIQLERQKDSLFPSLREYAKLFGINGHTLAKFKKDVLVMHPGPINRGVEISHDVADGVNTLIEEQVRNGVVVRMAVLYLLEGSAGKEITHETVN
jgi:aspartate carbamoyltransferase catalytic subunit